MTDIAITYEDGLRLSELQGQLAQLQYDLAHVGTTSLTGKVAMCILLTIVMIFVFFLVLWVLDAVIWDCINGDRIRGIVTLVSLGAVIVGFIVIMIFGCSYVEQYDIIDIESQMANIQGQIDAIYARYGM